MKHLKKFHLIKEDIGFNRDKYISDISDIFCDVLVDDLDFEFLGIKDQDGYYNILNYQYKNFFIMFDNYALDCEGNNYIKSRNKFKMKYPDLPYSNSEFFKEKGVKNYSTIKVIISNVFKISESGEDFEEYIKILSNRISRIGYYGYYAKLLSSNGKDFYKYRYIFHLAQKEDNPFVSKHINFNNEIFKEI